MSARHLVITTLLGGSAQPVVDSYAMTSGRVWSLVGALIGLAGTVIGALALARSAGRADAAKRKAAMALGAGLASVVIGGWVVAAAEGGPGTGYGIVGGYVALVVGFVAMVIGGVVLARSRRTV